MRLLAKGIFFEIRAATAALLGQGRRNCETMMRAVFLFSGEFQPRTHIHNLEGGRHSGVGTLVLKPYLKVKM